MLVAEGWEVAGGVEDVPDGQERSRVGSGRGVAVVVLAVGAVAGRCGASDRLAVVAGAVGAAGALEAPAGVFAAASSTTTSLSWTGSLSRVASVEVAAETGAAFCRAAK
jgi:hypothetical protein